MYMYAVANQDIFLSQGCRQYVRGLVLTRGADTVPLDSNGRFPAKTTALLMHRRKVEINVEVEASNMYIYTCRYMFSY